MSKDSELRDSQGGGRSSAVGLGDLLKSLAGVPEGEREAVAQLLGYEKAVPSPPDQRRAEQSRDLPPVEDEARKLGGITDPWQHEPPPSIDPRSAIKLWRPVQVEFQYDHDETPKVELTPPNPLEVLSLEDIGRFGEDEQRKARARLRHRPIVLWSQLRRRLEQVFRVLRPIGSVDIDELVERSSRAEVFSQIPRLSQRVQARRLFMVLDCAPRLAPFEDDMCAVSQRVVSEVGLASMEVLIWEGGPPSWCRRTGDVLQAVHRSLAPGDVLLAMSDLGIYGAPGKSGEALGPSSRHWLELGRALREHDVACTALLPCPSYRWPRALARAWDCIDWAAPVAGLGGAQGRSAGAVSRAPLERLVGLLSLCVSVEFELLRALRLSVPGADLSTEALAWGCLSGGESGVGMDPGLRREGEARVVEMLQDEDGRELVARAVELIGLYHRLRPREIWYEEVVRISAVAWASAELGQHFGALVQEEEFEAASRFMQRLTNSLEFPEQALGVGQGVDFDGWVLRALSGPEARVSELTKGDPRFGRSVTRAVELAVARRPASLRGEPTPADFGPGDFAPDGRLRRWSLRQRGDSLVLEESSGGTGSSAVVELVGYSGWVRLGGVPVHLEDGEGAQWRLPDVGEPLLVVETTGQRVVLEKFGRPEWALAMGRDEFGLWADFAVQGEEGKVEQRMRWIPPGRFVMGSPESEAERDDDEGPVLVTLSQGFWMADTPCTQELWTAVMGETPSRFERERSPVEQVSWEDVGRFLANLDARVGLGFARPTEAQWEYACRAGGTEARYGELDKVAWFWDNAGQRTHEVAMNQPNDWGLYDMLGNVDEWCEDWAGLYQLGTVIDPRGPQSGGYRVIRGGGWNSSAQYVRAASRHAHPPDYRYGSLGFRLVRGQGSKRKQDKVGEVRPGDPNRGQPAWFSIEGDQ